MIAGFNTGQMHHYISLKYGAVTKTPKRVINDIKKVVPQDLLENVRSTGTVANYQNLHEVGYGSYKNTAPLWGQLVSQRGSFMDKLKFLMYAITKNEKAIMDMGRRHVTQPYLISMVEDYKQLGCKTMAFTFNSHMPFLGHCRLDQSVTSLEYVDEHTNLISIELENETYFDQDIIGDSKTYKKKIDDFIIYLESQVVPAITQAVGKNIPLGISFCNSKVIQYRYWRQSVLALAKRLKSKGYEVFVVPHIYSHGYDTQAIMDEINYELDGVSAADIKIRITEYNAHSSAGNCSQNEALDYIDRFIKVCKHKGISAAYYHSLYTVPGAHFSFVK